MTKRIFHAADILLPQKNFETWAVIACDQFTSEPEYWKKAEEIVGEQESALRLVLPEVYLGEGEEARIRNINATMQEYSEKGVLKEYKDSMIYIERETSDGIRRGLVGMIDLEEYDYHAGAQKLIRATEETVLERIPPRVRIRRDASLELPHVLLLIDDPEKSVIEPLGERAEELETAYDFDLMLGGGHIKGSFVDRDHQEKVLQRLDALQEKCKGLLFAVGDGNHSLATAKECSSLSDSPRAKTAMVELVNIHDPSLVFEPIYRVVFGVDEKALLAELEKALGTTKGENTQKVLCITKDGEKEMHLKATSKLTVGTLQTFLDAYLKNHTEAKIDYIHGEDSVRGLCKKENTLGFLFDGMKKDELFEAVRSDGALPRKTFSMGCARDKRYYIEARKIK